MAVPIVKTKVYEGPLDLLLELIEKRKLLINDISLSQVTDEYIARIAECSQMPVGEASEFISLAATLLLIKSRSLLPTLTISDDESRDIKELQYRLAVYQLIKDAASALRDKRGESVLFAGNAPMPMPIFIFDSALTAGLLHSAANSLIAGFPVSFALPNVSVKKIATIEETITKLAARVSSAFKLSFREFSGLGNPPAGGASTGAKHTIIVSFLALLELLKQGIIKANQSEHFGDITLESDSVSTPLYE